MSDEWYPRECEFCTWEAALTCQIQDCSCVTGVRNVG